jgi:hypothetical protein
VTAKAEEVAMNKLDQTKAELRRIIEGALGRDLIDEIRVTAQENRSGEPAYYVGVTMKATKDMPDIPRQNELTHRLKSALAARDDYRFPYLFLNAADDESGPGDADEFESLDEDIRDD